MDTWQGLPREIGMLPRDSLLIRGVLLCMPARLRTEGTPAGIQRYQPGLGWATLGSVPPKLESWAAA